MSAPSKVRPDLATPDLPAVPLTLEGSSVLHQMMRFRWSEWRKLKAEDRSHILAEAEPVLRNMEEQQSALYSLLGHKGDLMLVHFRPSFDELKQAELRLAATGLSDYLESTTSYLSVVELGLYDSSVKLYRQLANGVVRSLVGNKGERNFHGTALPVRCRLFTRTAT